MPRPVSVLTAASWGAALLMALLGCAAVAARAEGVVDGSDSIGARIYAKGLGSAPIVARVAGGAVEVSGRLFPCGNCHKADGLGVVEGGLKPRDITWPTLTEAAGGRMYDEASLRGAIRDGVDAHGLPLGAAMPRYRMDEADLTATIAYLHTLDQAGAPGVTGADVRVAALLPLHGRLGETARLVERFLNLAVLDINTRRRFDGRRITLVSVPFDADVPGDALRAAKAVQATQPPFCFVAGFGFAPDDPVQGFLAGVGVPNLAPLVAPYRSEDRSAIWIEPSVADQARALVQAVADAGAPGPSVAGPVRLALVSNSDTASQVAAQATRDEIGRLGATLLFDQLASAPLPDLVGRLHRAKIEAVFVFGPYDDAAAFVVEAARQQWHPLLLGRWQELGAIEQDPALHHSAEFLLVTSHGGVEPRSRGAYDFRRVAGELGGGHPELLRDAYVGAKLLEAALAATGRHLTQPGLFASIAGLRGFATGVMPPLSFEAGASRQRAAAVMRLDPDRGRLVPFVPENHP